MTHLEFYKKFKDNVSKVELWLGMLGKQYYGGGGGIGRAVNFKPGSIEIYYQFNNGDTNYHTIPSEVLPFVQEVLLEKEPRNPARSFCKNATTSKKNLHRKQFRNTI